MSRRVFDRLGFGGGRGDGLVEAEEAGGERERAEHRAENGDALPYFGGQAPGRFDGHARPGIAGHGVGEGGDVGGGRDEAPDDRRGLARRELDLAAVGLGFGGRVDGREEDGRPIAVLEGHDGLELRAGDADHVLDRLAGDLEPGIDAEGHGEAPGEIVDELSEACIHVR